MALAPRFHTVIAGPARKNDPQVIEAIMAAAVKPGSLVMLDSTGKLAVHNEAGGAGVALALQHNYIGGGDIRDLVPAGDTGLLHRFPWPVAAVTSGAEIADAEADAASCRLSPRRLGPEWWSRQRQYLRR